MSTAGLDGTSTVGMPFIAKDVQTGLLTSASAGIRKRKYTCLCPEAHAMCLRQGSTRTAHFAHLPLQQEDSVVLSCRKGGESEQHVRAKHKLVEWQGRYTFALKKCMVCKESVMEDCKNGRLNLEMQSNDKRWRYDVLLTRPDTTRLALEVYYTHITGDDKIESSAVQGVPIAEFDAQDILDLQPGGVLLNMRTASWICSQACVDRKHQKEQEAAKLIEDKKQLEAARIAKEEQLEAARIIRENTWREKRQKQNEEDLAEKPAILKVRAEAGEFMLTFGKHRNTRIKDLPIGYLQWILGVRQNGRHFNPMDQEKTVWIRTNHTDCYLEARRYMQWRCWSCGINDSTFKDGKLCRQCWSHHQF